MAGTKRKFYIISEKDAKSIIENNEGNLFVINWDSIPDEILDVIDDDYLYTHYYMNSEGELLVGTVVYAKTVSRFPNGTFKANIDNGNIIGVKDDIY